MVGPDVDQKEGVDRQVAEKGIDEPVPELKVKAVLARQIPEEDRESAAPAEHRMPQVAWDAQEQEPGAQDTQDPAWDMQEPAEQDTQDEQVP